jgi:hypothetical protein
MIMSTEIEERLTRIETIIGCYNPTNPATSIMSTDPRICLINCDLLANKIKNKIHTILSDKKMETSMLNDTNFKDIICNSLNKSYVYEPTLLIENNECIAEIKQLGMRWVDTVLEGELTYTKPGSISHLLYGSKPSEQSVNIKLGRLGEFISKELIKSNHNLELLNCGIQKINDKKKDVDLIFKDELNKIIYYFELKGNIELDTEKLPATIHKCKEIENSLKTRYLDYSIKCGILNWSVFNRQILTAGVSNIKTFETGGIQIYHMEDFLNIINVFWNEDDYYSYFREIGTKIRLRF